MPVPAGCEGPLSEVLDSCRRCEHGLLPMEDPGSLVWQKARFLFTITLPCFLSVNFYLNTCRLSQSSTRTLHFCSACNLCCVRDTASCSGASHTVSEYSFVPVLLQD